MKAVRAKAQAKIARENKVGTTVSHYVLTNEEILTPNQSKITSLKPWDDAPMPTENNGKSYPTDLNQSQDPAHNIARLDNNTTETTEYITKIPDTGPYTHGDNGNSQLDKSFVEVVTNSA